MTTAVPEKPQTETKPYPVLHEGPVSLDQIKTNGNFRKHFDEKSLKELADNISKVGVLQPILLRKHQGKEFLLIAGERRLRAAKLAKLTVIPARVLDVTEDQAQEIQALENLHREDLGPIEQAQAFKTLLDQGHYTVEDLARRVDKSEGFVYRALRLLDLVPEAQEAIEAGDMTEAAGHQLLRAPAAVQKELTKHILGGRISTVGELAEHIEDRIGHDLAKAPWVKDKEYAGKPACNTCPFNSGNQGMLFADAKKGRCTNAECFDAKQHVYLFDLAENKSEKTGLKNLGVKEGGWNNEVKGMKDALMVPEESVKELVKEQPEKFAVVGLKPYSCGDKPRAALVCLDPKILPNAGRGQIQSPQQKAARKTEIARQKRERAIKEAMFLAVYKMLPAITTKTMWLTIIQELDKSYRPMEIWKGLGIEKHGSSAVEVKELEKLDAGALARISFLLAAGDFTDYNRHPNQAYLAVGLKPGEIRKKAEKEVAMLAKKKGKEKS